MKARQANPLPYGITTRQDALDELNKAIASFKDMHERGSAATTDYDLNMGYWPCWSIYLLKNHVTYYAGLLQHFPPTMFDLDPDISWLPDEPSETIKGCTCPKHLKG